MLLAVLFLVGLYFVAKEAVRHSAKNVRAARNHARQRATARGGRYDTTGVKRRAARQATAGYWGGELLSWPPLAHTREGLRAGWAEHRHILLQMERDRRAREAQHAKDRKSLLAEIEEYLRLRREADGDPGPAQPGQPPPHVMGPPDPPQQQQQEEPDHVWVCTRCGSRYQREARPADGICATCRMNESKQPPQDNPGGDGCTCTIPPDGNPGHASIIDANCPIHGTRNPPDPATNGNRQNGDHPMSGDANYDEVIRLTEAVLASADLAISETALKRTSTLADELGGIIGSDSTTQGVVGELAQAAQDVYNANIRLKDAAEAVKARVESAYGPIKEQADSTGADAGEFVRS